MHHVSADNNESITYKNMQLYSVDNEHNAIKIKYSGQSTEPETIHNVPIKVRHQMSEMFQTSGDGMDRNQKFNLTVSNNNKFKSIKFIKEDDTFSFKKLIHNFMDILETHKKI